MSRLFRAGRARPVIGSRVRRVALAAATWAAIVLPADAIAAPTSYALVCKGGGSAPQYVQWMPDSTHWWMGFQFVKSAHAGNSGKLSAGECAWLDRPINKDEPEWVHVKSDGWKVIGVTVLRDSKIKEIHLGVDNGQLLSGSNMNKVQQLFKDVLTKDKLFYLHAYKDNKVLRVTKIGP